MPLKAPQSPGKSLCTPLELSSNPELSISITLQDDINKVKVKKGDRGNILFYVLKDDKQNYDVINYVITLG